MSNIININDILKPSPLEEEYIQLYGKEFVEDLKRAYLWMRSDMRKQPSAETVVCRRKRKEHKIGDWISVFYVDFRNEDFYSQTIDDSGGKTIHNYGNSPLLKTDNDHNIRYLLSGMYFYDKDKTRKWLDKLLGENEKFWFERV